MVSRKTDEVFPGFWGEDTSTQALRRQIQKPFSQEDFVTFYLFRPFSLYVSLWIVKYTRITANLVTYFMVLLAAIAPMVVYAVPSFGSAIVLGSLLYHAAFFLDMVDGEVARLRQSTSKKGEIVDAMLWFLFPFLYGIYAVRIGQELGTTWVGMVVATSMVASVTSDMLQKLFAPNWRMSKYIPKTYNLRGIVAYALRYLLSQSGIYLVAPLVWLSPLPNRILIVYLVAVSTIYFVFAFLRLRRTLRGADREENA